MDSLFSLGLAVRPALEQPLRTSVMAYCGPRLQFAALRLSPHSTSFGIRKKADSSRFLVSLNKEGPTLVAQDGRQTCVGVNQMFLIDPSRTFHIESGHILTYSIYLPAASLRALLPQIDEFTARAIDCRTGPAAILRAMLDELILMAPNLSDGDAEAIADMLPHALVTALCSLDQASVTPESRQRTLHRQRVKRFARENLGDHTLCGESIARAVNLSVRYIYELFAAEDLPLMRWVWSERLERCKADLETPSLRCRAIGEVAYNWGFNSLAHFSRAFCERYGEPPSAFRRKKAQMLRPALIPEAQHS
jgi:AraC family transcriptional activator of tynA and feaB